MPLPASMFKREIGPVRGNVLRGMESLIRLTSVRGVLHSRVSWNMYLEKGEPFMK
jgi:hypothetical protein